VSLIELKRTLAAVLPSINLVLLVWALLCWRRRATLPGGFYRLLPLSPLVAAVQLILGITFVSQGLQAPLMHMFYGVLTGLGATGQALLSRRTALGQANRARPLTYAFLALFVLLLGVRSWMAAR